MRIVSSYERKSGIVREPVEFGNYPLILIEVVILHFKEKVAAAKYVGVGVSLPPGLFVPVRKNGLSYLAAQAGGEGDQALRMLREKVQIDAGLVIEPFEKPCRDELNEIAVAFLRLAKQNEVVIAVGLGRVLCPCCAIYTSQPMTGWMPAALAEL